MLHPALAARGWRQISVKRNQIVLSGFYCGPWGRIRGRIVVIQSPLPGYAWIDFYLVAPPKWVTSWQPFNLCLRREPGSIDEYAVHWKEGQQPQSILAGVFSIERTLAEVFRRCWGERCFPDDL